MISTRAAPWSIAGAQPGCQTFGTPGCTTHFLAPMRAGNSTDLSVHRGVVCVSGEATGTCCYNSGLNNYPRLSAVADYRGPFLVHSRALYSSLLTLFLCKTVHICRRPQQALFSVLFSRQHGSRHAPINKAPQPSASPHHSPLAATMALQAGSIIRVSLKGQPEPVDITVVKRMCQGGHAQVLQGSAGGGETLYALKLPDISSSVHLEVRGPSPTIYSSSYGVHVASATRN